MSCFAGGPLSAPYVADSPVVISDPYNSRVNVSPTVMPTHNKIWATAGQIGSVYGIAYSPSTSKAYASAYVKLHTQLGAGNGGNPSGLGSAGAIYALSPPASGGGPSTVTVLVDIGAAAGTTVRTPSSDWTCDPAIYEVGRVGWGDIDVSLDGSILWAMNLYNKSLYKINATSGAILGTYSIPGVTGGLPFDAPITTNENLDLRPFGLKVTDTKVYVGVVSSGESLYPSGGLPDPCNSPIGTPALRGYIFSFDISGSTFSNTPVLDFPFQGASWNNGLCDNYGTGDKWMYWMPFANMQSDYGGWAIQQRSPAIADIEIDAAGNFLIGLRNITNDRLSTIPGLFFPDCVNGSHSGGFGGFGGQLLKACGGPSSWTIESNGSCGGNSGFNNQVFYDYQSPHSNGNYGGSIAYKTGSGEILSPASSGGDQGSMYFIQEATKAPSGTYNVIYSLQAFPNDPNANPLFGKANGLGDVDLQTILTCPPATNPGLCNNNILVNSTLENGNFDPPTGTFVGSPYKLISNTDAVLNNWWVNKGYWIDALNAGGGPDGSCKIVWIDPSYGNSICIYPVPDVNLTANQCYTMSVWAAPFDPNNPTAAQTMSFDLVTNSSSEQFIVIDNNGGGTVNTFDDGAYGVVSTTINLGGNTAPLDINGSPFTNASTQTLDWSTLNWQLVTITFHVTQNMPLSVNYSINDATSNGVVFDNPVFGECCASSSSCTGNLLVNPSFETGDFSGWSRYNPNVEDGVFTDPLINKDGTYYSVVSPDGNADTQQYLYQDINITAGSIVNLSVYAAIHDPSVDHQIKMQFLDGSNNVISEQNVQVDHDIDLDNTLVQYTLTGTAPAGSVKVRVKGYVNGTFTGNGGIGLKTDGWCLTVTAPPCVVQITSVTTLCNNNGTSGNSGDDFFNVTVSGTITGGSSNYLVKIYNGATLLYTSGGTPSGSSITISGNGLSGNPLLQANGASTYTLRIEDAADNTCFSSQAVGPVMSCSNCPTSNCFPTIVTKTN